MTRILLVGADESELSVLDGMLAPLGYETKRVRASADALDEVIAAPYALIVTAHDLTGSDGLQTIAKMKRRDGGQHTPILVLVPSAAATAEALRAGATDVLVQPCEPHALRARVGLFAELAHHRAERLAGREREQKLEERVRLLSLEVAVAAALGQRSGGLHEVAAAIVHHLDAAFARVWTLSADGTTLELRASAGMYTHLDGPHGRVPVGQFKIGEIAEQRRPHLTNQVVGDPRVGNQEWAKSTGMVAFAGHPLVVDDRLVGVIAAFAQHPFSNDALALLGTLATRVAESVSRRA